MRFRREGLNWEGRAWKTSASLNALMDEIEATFPKKNRADGTVASESHDANSPTSDHRPYPYTGPGVVNAVDVGSNIDGEGIIQADAIVAVRDPRFRYLIHRGRSIWSTPHNGFPAYTWQPYLGPNPHDNHVHVSVNRSNHTDGRPWGLEFFPEPPQEDTLLPINAASSREDIRLFQGRAGVKLTGVWDAETVTAAAQIAVDSGTGDPLGKDGTHCNAVMFNYITLVWVGTTAVDPTARAEAKRANDRISGIVIPK